MTNSPEPGTRAFELAVIAQNAIDHATQDLDDQIEAVRLWDDEWEQWHVDESGEPTVQLPAEAVDAYRLAARLWADAQQVLSAAVNALRDGFPEEARDHGWVDELFRGEITWAELEARLEPCPHPEDQLEKFERGDPETGRRWRSVKCPRCAQYVGPVGYQDDATERSTP